MSKDTEKSKAPKGQKVTKEFIFKLTMEEAEQLNAAAGNLHKEVLSLEAKKKEAVKEWSEKINKRQTRLTELLDAFASREEKRTVEAMMYKDFDALEVRYEFNGVVLERRSMTEQERQAEMDLREKKSAPVSNEERGERARAVRQRITGDPVADAHADEAGLGRADMEDVIRMETKRGSKTSSVDGPTRN